MTPEDALGKFRNQQARAKRRGIGWELTFKQWCDWWGDDIDRRGPGHGQLVMCRRGDAGNYTLGNIYKGTPKVNAKTAGVVGRTRRTEQLRQQKEAAQDAMMFAPSAEPMDEQYSEDQLEIMKMTGAFDRHVARKFVADKRR